MPPVLRHPSVSLAPRAGPARSHGGGASLLAPLAAAPFGALAPPVIRLACFGCACAAVSLRLTLLPAVVFCLRCNLMVGTSKAPDAAGVLAGGAVEVLEELVEVPVEGWPAPVS